MSAGKGLRRIPGSEAVSSIEQDSLECLSSVSPACTSSPSLSPNPKSNPQNSLQEIIDAELAARLQPLEDSLEESRPELQQQESYSEADPNSSGSVLLDSLDTSNYSMDSLTSGVVLVGKVHSSVEVTDPKMEPGLEEFINNVKTAEHIAPFVQNGQDHHNYVTSEGPQCSIILTEASDSNDIANGDVEVLLKMTSSSEKYEITEQVFTSTSEIEQIVQNVDNSLDSIQDKEPSSRDAPELISLDSTESEQIVQSYAPVDNYPLQEERESDIVVNNTSSYAEGSTSEYVMLNEDKYLSNNGQVTDSQMSHIDINEPVEIADSELVELNSSDELLDVNSPEILDVNSSNEKEAVTPNEIIPAKKSYSPFDVNAYLESLSSPNRFNDTNSNAEIVSSNVVDNNTSNGNVSLDIKETNETSSLDASANVTNDGIKSPMLDEFEKMEQAVEEEEKRTTTNGIDKKRKDGEKKKKRKKKKPESEKENKVCNQLSSSDHSSAEDTSQTKEFPAINGSTVISPEQTDIFAEKIHEIDLDTSLTDDDSLSGINVKSLTANYLNVADSYQTKRSSSPGDDPVRPKTPVSQLVSNYSPSHSPLRRNEDSSPFPADFTPISSLKTLKSAYEACANKSTGNISCNSPVSEELSVSLAQLRNSYCSAANGVDICDQNAQTNIRSMESNQVSSECRICGKPVFQMEKIVAEKASWHKNCFRCKECNIRMTLESYQSHEGSLYCKPHFKELFRPKAVIHDEAEERKDRSTAKPDYGLEDLQRLNVRQRFSMFENADKAEEAPKLENISVQRSRSLLSKAARFYGGDENTNGLDLDEEEEEEDEYEDGDELVNGEINGVVKSRKKKERPMSFNGIGDLKNAWEQKHRREEMTQARREEVGRFRQLLCAGKNNALKEMFENGKFEQEDDDDDEAKQKVMIEVTHAAKSLRERFEKGQPFILEDDEERNGTDGSHNSIDSERKEVDEIFKEAETAKNARNVFKQIDSVVAKEGAPVMRSKSFAQAPRENRCSQDVSFLALQMSPSTAEVIKASEKQDDFHIDTTDLASRFKFFATYEKELEVQKQKSNKVFRITPPRDGVDQGMKASDDIEVGRDPNLIKCTDKYEDDVDCTNTKNILHMFRKLEMAKEDDTEQDSPRPLKSFTPPLEGDHYNGDSGDDDDEYSDEEFSDEDTQDEEDERPKYKDEILEMSAKKAAHLRARFERYETEDEHRNSQDQESEECRPSLDTARNLRAMFENKAVEESKPVVRNASSAKINRFVGGGGERCVVCEKNVYAMEKLELQGKVLHKNCFKCFKCNTRLSMGSFSLGGNRMFCTTHYKQLFTEKGSYDAFTGEKVNWTEKIEAINGDLIKSHD